ncbi:MAG: orotate phosphoribosyltransferase [Firmicutes bacterium]|nr:orotate phosphoribosyltransferase [Bacillota bacterium]
MTNQEMIKLFEDCGAKLSGHFLLTSGRHSDTYMQCAKLFENPQVSETLCKALTQKMGVLGVDVVASPAIGGIIMGYELAKQRGKRNVFCERVENKMELRRGFDIQKGTKVLVCEDVVTTGGSIKEVIDLMEFLGAQVVACCSIVDRSNGSIDFGVPYHSLLSLQVTSYEKQNCPQCKSGIGDAYKMGSRK